MDAVVFGVAMYAALATVLLAPVALTIYVVRATRRKNKKEDRDA